MNKWLKKATIILTVLLLLILIAFSFLSIKSPGKAIPFEDGNGGVLEGSISRITEVKLGDLKQHLIIRGKDSLNPVLLFLHGGPGSPEYAFLKNPKLNLEDEFVVVYWEQRGAGKSYSKEISPESMSLDQLVYDALELSQLLCQKFNRKKIYVMGHSWGTLIGMKAINIQPELFHAYVGIGQVSNQYEAEKISLNWVVEKALELENKNAQSELNEITLPLKNASNKEWLDYLMIQRKYVNDFGGGMTRKKFNTWTGVAKRIINTKEYTLRDKYKFLKGNFFSMNHLWDDELKSNLFEEIDSLQVPVYFFHGIYDYQAPLEITQQFYNQLKAVKKEFFLFEKSAHSPFLDEVEEFNSLVKEVIKSQEHNQNINADDDKLVKERLDYVLDLKSIVSKKIWPQFSNKDFEGTLVYKTSNNSYIFNPTTKVMSLNHESIPYNKTKLIKMDSVIGGKGYSMSLSVTSGEKYKNYINYNYPVEFCSDVETVKKAIPSVFCTELWATMVLHEMFHHYQRNLGFDGRGNDKKHLLKKYFQNTNGFKERIIEENELLMKLLNQQEIDRKVLKNFIAKRKDRYKSMPTEIKKIEVILEKIEGSARYIEAKAMESIIDVPVNDYLKENDTLYDSNKSFKEFDISNEKYLTYAGGKSSFYYATGYNLLLLFDKLGIEYKNSVFKNIDNPLIDYLEK